MRHFCSWGRYSFLTRKYLKLQFEGMQVDGGPTTRQAPNGATVSSHQPIEIAIGSDEARVTSTAGSMRAPFVHRAEESGSAYVSAVGD